MTTAAVLDPIDHVRYSEAVVHAPAQQAPGSIAFAELAGVRKRYGATTAVDGVSLALRPGEVVALLGPNGAGKSTIVRMLLGLIAPSEGSARVFGKDPRDAAARTRIGAMLQVARIPETLRVCEHIDLFRSYYPHPLPVAEIITLAQLHGIEHRLFGQLSGGQKQRVLFALALCGDPDLVFLDEPTVGLDIEARRRLWSQVRALAAHGKAVLLTTHYLEEADALADRIVVLNRGRIVSEGTPAQIKSATSGRNIRCRTHISADVLRALPGVTEVTEDHGRVVITAADADSVIRELLQRDASLSGLEVTSPALEDAFLALTSTPHS